MSGFPLNASQPVTRPGPPPRTCDVAVIGGGVIGILCALFLARRGQKVVLCEKGRIAAEQSGRGWGWIRQQGRDPHEIPLMAEASKLWPALQSECQEDFGYRRSGVLFLAGSGADMVRYEDWLAAVQEHELDSRTVSIAEISRMMPDATALWKGGLLTESDAQAEPLMAVPALARGAEAAGVTMVENCAVRALDMASGRIRGILTEQGRIACEQVVLAGGAWSALFLRRQGVVLPQLGVVSTVAATAALPPLFAGAAAEARLAFRRRQDGGYTIAPGVFHEFFPGPDAFRFFPKYLPQLRAGTVRARLRFVTPRNFPDGWRTPRHWEPDERSPFEMMRVLNPEPNRRALARIVERFAEVFPTLGRPGLRMAWGGMIDILPDSLPVIDRVSQIPGLTLATGFSGHGFGIAPAVGRIVADLVTGHVHGHDLRRFRLGRFADGTAVDLSRAL